MEDNDQLHSSTALLSRKRAHVTHLIGILVGPDTGLDFCREQSHSGRDLNHDFLVVQPVGQLLHVLDGLTLFVVAICPNLYLAEDPYCFGYYD
jgi:hypothetical protein